MNKSELYWIVYYIGDDEKFVCDKYDIFAFTNDKKSINLFKKQRDMNLFKIKKEELDLSERNELLKYNMNSELSIEKIKILMKEDFEVKECDISLTRTECRLWRTQSSLYKDESIFRSSWKSPHVLKSKYLEALQVLLYESSYMYVHTGNDVYCDKIQNSIIINDFNILMDIIQTSIKKG